MRPKRRVGFIVASLGLVLAAGVASPSLASGSNNTPQPISKADANPGGANGQCPTGPYCSTRDGSPSLNGNGGGLAVGKPDAGAVGKADNKNPPGQMPNGSDKNAGYECDRNKGVGPSNPAHTGCKTPVTPPVNPPPVNPPPVNPPPVNPPPNNPPAGDTPVANPPEVLGEVLDAPTAVTPVKTEVLGEALAAPKADTNPLPTGAAAGQADTSGQLAAGGLTAFAAFLALGAGAVLRRRHGDA